MKKLIDHLKRIDTKNQIIKNTGSVIGVSVGALASNYINPNDLSAMAATGLIGGIVGDQISNKFTTGLSEEIDKIVFGPYVDKFYYLVETSLDIISYISDLHKDFSYKKAERKVLDEWTSSKSDLNIKSSQYIKKLRQIHVNLLSYLLNIIGNYCKEKRSHPEVHDFYLHQLEPEFQVIKKYLQDSKVILDHIENLISESIGTSLIHGLKLHGIIHKPNTSDLYNGILEKAAYKTGVGATAVASGATAISTPSAYDNLNQDYHRTKKEWADEARSNRIKDKLKLDRHQRL